MILVYLIGYDQTNDVWSDEPCDTAHAVGYSHHTSSVVRSDINAIYL